MQLQQKFPWAADHVDWHQPCAGVGCIEDLAAHCGMAVVEDDQGFFQNSLPPATATVSALISCALGMYELHWFFHDDRFRERFTELGRLWDGPIG
jgi:hypothetical protein